MLMIPKKTNADHNEYIALHYKLQKHYRKSHPYIPFRYIQRRISRRWQLRCYEKNNSIKQEETCQTTMIRWSENIEQVKLF